MKNTLDKEINQAIRKIRAVNTPNAIWSTYQIATRGIAQIECAGQNHWQSKGDALAALSVLRATTYKHCANDLKIVRLFFIEEVVAA